MNSLQAYKYLLKHPSHSIKNKKLPNSCDLYQILKSGNIIHIHWSGLNPFHEKHYRWIIEKEYSFDEFIQEFNNDNFTYCNEYFDFN